MNKQLLDRLQELGANIEKVKGQDLLEDLQAIEFECALYSREHWGDELYGIDLFFEKNKELYQRDTNAFYQLLVAHFFSLADNYYSQMFYKGELFTPFKEDTEDFEQWNEIFVDEEQVDLSLIYQVSDTKRPDFLQLFFSYSYPDHYYVCLSDNNPQNPSVFSTDHEVFWSEVENESSLSEFLKQFYTKEEFLVEVKQYIEQSLV